MAEKIILAISAALGSFSVLLTRNDTVLSKTDLPKEKNASDSLFQVLEDITTEHNLSLRHVTAFVACTGPGNFTSLRIAISAVRGLALSCKKPSIGISAFETLCAESGPSLIVLKGPRDQLYIQEFKNGIKISEPESMSINVLINKNYKKNICLIGYNTSLIGPLIGTKNVLERREVNLQKLINLTLKRINKVQIKPKPLYIEQVY
jgi:tRNA threonylcarbamoyl adenosine modification protein YeaZ